jgi:hypothetical protein
MELAGTETSRGQILAKDDCTGAVLPMFTRSCATTRTEIVGPKTPPFHIPGNNFDEPLSMNDGRLHIIPQGGSK